MANNQNRNVDQPDQQGEGYQDQNEQESRESRSDYPLRTVDQRNRHRPARRERG